MLRCTPNVHMEILKLRVLTSQHTQSEMCVYIHDHIKQNLDFPHTEPAHGKITRQVKPFLLNFANRIKRVLFVLVIQQDSKDMEPRPNHPLQFLL